MKWRDVPWYDGGRPYYTKVKSAYSGRGGDFEPKNFEERMVEYPLDPLAVEDFLENHTQIGSFNWPRVSAIARIIFCPGSKRYSICVNTSKPFLSQAIGLIHEISHGYYRCPGKDSSRESCPEGEALEKLVHKEAIRFCLKYPYFAVGLAIKYISEFQEKNKPREPTNKITQHLLF